MLDRIPTQPNRIKLTTDQGVSEYYTLERADEPVVEGTPLNRSTLLSPEVQELLELPDECTLSDALMLLIPYAHDTGWQPLWPNDDPTYDDIITVHKYGSYYAPSYRKIGKTVYLRGCVQPNAEASTVVVGRLPVDCRPDPMMPEGATSWFSIIQGSQSQRALMTVEKDGKIVISRYGYGTTSSAMSTSVWLPFSISFVSSN